jgi:transcription antitermination protein NusB
MRSARRRAREFALQGLYQWQMTGASTREVARNLTELEGYGAADEAFLKTELAGVIKESDALRAQLEPLADRKWAEVSPVERAILMMSAWELNHVPEMPYRVSINEAIELAKRFGGTDGHKYVNGILDRVAAAVRPQEVAAGREPGRKPRRAAASANRSPSVKKADA